MEVKAWSYQDIPECELIPEDAHVILTSGQETGVTYLHDVVYANTPEGDLRLQILVPDNREIRIGAEHPVYPCLVYVQGSAWMKQALYKDVPQLAKLARRGYVVAIVEYRDSTRAHYPKPILDALNAVRFMRKNAANFRVDPEKIIMSGNSSGGHTALMAGLWCREDHGDNLYPDTSSEVLGVISWYASGDFLFADSNPTTPNHTKADSPEGMEMGGDMTPEMCRELTVRTHVSEDAQIPPILLLHGTKDRLVNTKCSIYLYETLKKCGKEASLYLLKGADHGGNEFWTDEMTDIYEKYILDWCGRKKYDDTHNHF